MHFCHMSHQSKIFPFSHFKNLINKDKLDIYKMYNRRMRDPHHKIQEFDQNMTETPPFKETYTKRK